MAPLTQFGPAHRLKALGAGAARTATLIVQVTLISLGLAGAGELLGFLPVWLQSLVSRTAAVEQDGAQPGKALSWKQPSEGPGSGQEKAIGPA